MTDYEEVRRRYPTDRGKPRRRAMVNMLVDGLASVGVYGISKHDSPARLLYRNLPGDGALQVTASRRHAGEGLRQAKLQTVLTCQEEPGGWTGLLLDDTTMGPAVMLPLPEFLKIMQRLGGTE